MVAKFDVFVTCVNCLQTIPNVLQSVTNYFNGDNRDNKVGYKINFLVINICVSDV